MRILKIDLCILLGLLVLGVASASAAAETAAEATRAYWVFLADRGVGQLTNGELLELARAIPEEAWARRARTRASALPEDRDRPLHPRMLVFGEVGLSGEVRPVANGEDRLREAAKHGFERAVIPRANRPQTKKIGDLELIPVARLADALDVL